MIRHAMRGVAVFLMLVVVTRPAAAQAPPLLVAQGAVEKADKETLTVKTREPDGKFGKTLALKLTGTSKVTTLKVVMRAGKAVLRQEDTEAKDLETKQSIAIVYTTLKDGPVLLTAVVQPAGEK
jgi:hypothetical protein